MYYEINISQLKKDGTYIHFLATSKRSLVDQYAAREALAIIKEKFPSPEYEITISRYELTGEELNW